MLFAMLRRAIAALAITGLMTSPVVASTRLFCRFTGIEIVGCTEHRAADQAVVRGETCCVRLTVQPVDTAERVITDFPAPALAVLPETVQRPAPKGRLAASEAPSTAAGPPMFLSHRALLI
jgi:hypothetical protein